LHLGLKLVAANGSQAVTVPAGRTLVVGRSSACDVPIRDLTVSRHHGEVEAAAAGLRVRDLGSTNGTFINGVRISEGVASPGTRVAFGKVIFQVMEERATGGLAEAGNGGDGAQVTVLDQLHAQGPTDVAALLAAESDAAAAGRALRVGGETPAERRAAALALLLETAKELSLQGEPARLLDKAARLLLQALRVDRVEILVRGDEDEMVPRVSKVRHPAAAGAAGGGRVPHTAARKASIERVAVLIAIAETAPGTGTDAISRVAQPAGPAAEAAGAAPADGADGAAGPAVVAAAAQAGAYGGDAAPAPQPVPSTGGHPILAATTDAVKVAVAGTDSILREGTGGSQGTGGERQTGADERDPRTGGGAAAAAERDPQRRGTAICAPLLGMQATALGLLYVTTPEAALGREELEFVTAFAGIVAVTLENLWLMARARDEALAQAGYQRHFAPFVADQIAGQHDGIRLDGDRHQVSFLCCEIRGVAELAEELKPEEIARLLKELYSEVVDVVFEHGGTLDRLTGTGLTALWGAPLRRPDDADEAVQAAIAMQRGLERLKGEWSRQQRPQLEIAIGIDLGQVFAGCVGSDRRHEYTAIGEPVVRSSALCAAALANEILVTAAVLEALASPPPADAVAAPTDGPGPHAAAPSYRIDWRTPPTLRQSGEVPLV
jgi:class 3 adenylate cyclase/pSer/pThr/pTyr-binding forkhead associated (FHA) protein